MFEALLTSLGTIAAGSLLHNGQQYRKLIALEGELATRLVIHVPVETFELAAPTITLEQPITLGCLGASQIVAIVAATSLVLALLVCGIWCWAAEDPYGLSVHDVDCAEQMISDLQDIIATYETACRLDAEEHQRIVKDLRNRIEVQDDCSVKFNEDNKNLRAEVARLQRQNAQMEEAIRDNNTQTDAIVLPLTSQKKELSENIQRLTKEDERLSNEGKRIARDKQEFMDRLGVIPKTRPALPPADDNVADGGKRDDSSDSDSPGSSPKMEKEDGPDDRDTSGADSERLDEDLKNGDGDCEHPDEDSANDDLQPMCRGPSISSSDKKNDSTDEAGAGDDHSKPSSDLGNSSTGERAEGIDISGHQGSDSDTTDENISDQQSGSIPPSKSSTRDGSSSDSRPAPPKISLDASRWAIPATNDNVGDQKISEIPNSNSSNTKEPVHNSGAARAGASLLDSKWADKARKSSSSNHPLDDLEALPLNGGLGASKHARGVDDTNDNFESHQNGGGRPSNSHDKNTSRKRTPAPPSGALSDSIHAAGPNQSGDASFKSSTPPTMPKAMRGTKGQPGHSTRPIMGPGSDFRPQQRYRLTQHPSFPGNRHWKNRPWNKKNAASRHTAPTVPAPAPAPAPASTSPAPQGLAGTRGDFSKDMEPGLGNSARNRLRG